MRLATTVGDAKAGAGALTSATPQKPGAPAVPELELEESPASPLGLESFPIAPAVDELPAFEAGEPPALAPPAPALFAGSIPALYVPEHPISKASVPVAQASRTVLMRIMLYQ